MERSEGRQSSGDGDYGRLVQMCIDAACKSKETVEVWRRQKRTLERMPSHLGDLIFNCLLKRRLLAPPLLEVFRQSVEEVNLKGEAFVDTEWLAYLGAYRHLRHVNLADCKAVNNSAIWNLAGITTLEELDLSRCSRVTNAGLEHLLSLPNLKILSISETGIKADGMARLSVLTSLTSLDLGGLPVTDLVVSSLQALTQLHQLDMWGSKISNEGAILLKAFPKLNCLNLAWTNVTQLPALVSLTSLNMSKCTIESILDGLEEPEISLLTLHFSGASFIDAYRVLSCLHAQNLTFLDLSGSSIDNVSFLTGMNRLESLDLSCTGVIDSSMNSVADIGANLKHLNLSTTRVTSDALAILAGNVPKLEFISLSHTMVDDNALAYLGLISALRNISLSFTNIKGFIHVGESESNPQFSLASLRKLEHLEILDLENTHISDLACQPLIFLKELYHLSLRSDFLSDISLHTVSSLPKLKYLSIQGAVVTKTGLCSFVPPPLLQVLDLSDCWLLTMEGILEFWKTYPQLQLRHELIVTIFEDQTHRSRGNMFSYETMEAFTVKQGRKSRSRASSSSLHEKQSRSRASSSSLHEKPTQRKFIDERIKYSKSELLRIRAGVHSALSFSEIEVSLPESLVKSGSK